MGTRDRIALTSSDLARKLDEARADERARVLRELRAGLVELELLDDLPDLYDIGYVDCWHDVRKLVASLLDSEGEDPAPVEATWAARKRRLREAGHVVAVEAPGPDPSSGCCGAPIVSRRWHCSECGELVEIADSVLVEDGGATIRASTASPPPVLPEAHCDRCGAPKGLHAVGEACNQNCGGRVVESPPPVGDGRGIGSSLSRFAARLRWLHGTSGPYDATTEGDYQEAWRRGVGDAHDLLVAFEREPDGPVAPSGAFLPALSRPASRSAGTGPDTKYERQGLVNALDLLLAEFARTGTIDDEGSQETVRNAVGWFEQVAGRRHEFHDVLLDGATYEESEANRA